VRVVDQAEHGAALGQIGEQRQARREGEEALVGRTLLETERPAERGCLRWRELPEMCKGRPHELVERGEWQLGFRLDAACRQHVHAARAVAGILEEGRLPDAGLAAQHEGAALRRSAASSSDPMRSRSSSRP